MCLRLQSQLRLWSWWQSLLPLLLQAWLQVPLWALIVCHPDPWVLPWGQRAQAVAAQPVAAQLAEDGAKGRL